jgi:hypothetical protein
MPSAVIFDAFGTLLKIQRGQHPYLRFPALRPRRPLAYGVKGFYLDCSNRAGDYADLLKFSKEIVSRL